jgi:hypothetical protein
MSELWGPITASNWHSVPCIEGRAATEADVKAGHAVFFVDGHSEAAPVKLPQCAIQTLDDGEELPVVVIQAEVAPYGVVLGVRPLAGGNGMCGANEVTFLPEGFESGMPPTTSLERTCEG